jgi:hypothetical protein
MLSFWCNAGDSPYQCWCCSRVIDSANGISLSDHVVDSTSGSQLEVHVCRKCWNNIPPQHRVWIKLVALSRSKGGIGGPEFLEIFERVLKATIKEYRVGRHFESDSEDENPESRWN